MTSKGESAVREILGISGICVVNFYLVNRLAIRHGHSWRTILVREHIRRLSRGNFKRRIVVNR